MEKKINSNKALIFYSLQAGAYISEPPGGPVRMQHGCVNI